LRLAFKRPTSIYNIFFSLRHLFRSVKLTLPKQPGKLDFSGYCLVRTDNSCRFSSSRRCQTLTLRLHLVDKYRKLALTQFVESVVVDCVALVGVKKAILKCVVFSQVSCCFVRSISLAISRLFQLFAYMHILPNYTKVSTHRN
jgi:hypothetical protein